MNKTIFHGEVILTKINSIPKQAEQIKINNDYFVVGESETHGNDHRVKVDNEYVTFFMYCGILYMKNTQETEIYCPKKDRHDTVKLSPGTRQISIAKEYDYLTKETRLVKD